MTNTTLNHLIQSYARTYDEAEAAILWARITAELALRKQLVG